MAMQTRVTNTMVLVAPAKTTQRPPPVSAALRVTGKTATGNRYAPARDSFTHRRWPVSQYNLGFSFSAIIK